MVDLRLLVLNANILIRAILGRWVLALLEAYADRVTFVAPEVAFTSVQTYLPDILAKRGLPGQAINDLLEREVLGRLPMLVTPVPEEVFHTLEEEARSRLARRDEADWPFVALALRFNCPIWTEDQDFFGCGVATWTTDRVELYLRSHS